MPFASSDVDTPNAHSPRQGASVAAPERRAAAPAEWSPNEPNRFRELGHAEYLASDHRAAFDGLRGVGFLLIVTAHVPSVRLFDYPQGWAAVWIFLVMSGYLVTMLMLREEKRV